jgi:tetratricopeptide (TPR) repeat protein
MPALIVCWARSSSEVQKIGGKPRLKLNHVFIILGTSLPVHDDLVGSDVAKRWHFIVHEREEVIIESESTPTQAGQSFSILFSNKSVRGSRGEIKFIDHETDLTLESLVFCKVDTDRDFIKKLLQLASEEWQSLSSAKAFLHLDPLRDVSAQLEDSPSPSRAEVGGLAKPSEDDLIYNCAETFYENGRYELATEALQLSLKQIGVRHRALNLMGLSYMKLGRPEFAVKHLALAANELPAMDELKKEIVYNLGLAYEESKEPDNALEQWKKIYEVDMGYRDVSNRVEKAYGL